MRYYYFHCIDAFTHIRLNTLNIQSSDTHHALLCHSVSVSVPDDQRFSRGCCKSSARGLCPLLHDNQTQSKVLFTLHFTFTRHTVYLTYILRGFHLTLRLTFDRFCIVRVCHSFPEIIIYVLTFFLPTFMHFFWAYCKHVCLLASPIKNTQMVQ